jgi:hypothetical protein
MLKKHKNQLFDLIIQNGLAINQFEIEHVNETSSIINFKESPFTFTILVSPKNYYEFRCSYKLFNPTFTSEYFPSEYSVIFVDFEKLCLQFAKWINNEIKAFIEEQNGMDLWNEYLNGNKTLNFETIDFGNKEPFTIDERSQIKMAINELKYLIKNQLETNEAEQQLVNDRLDYLIEASARLNKFDWKSLVISTLISITITLSLDTAKGQLIFNLFKKVFSSLPKLVDYLQS